MEKRIAVRMELEHGYLRHTGIFAGIHDYALAQGWRVIIDEWADHNLPTKPGTPLNYDGLVGRITSLGARRALRHGLPTVNVWFASPAKNLPGVFPDFQKCGRLWAEHLITRGFRNIGAAYHYQYYAAEMETNEIERTALEAGCTFSRFEWLRGRNGEPTHSPNPQQWRYGVKRLEAWLDTLTPPVGLFIDYIDLARLVIELCRARNWRIPEDVGIVSGSNEITRCERPEPSISSLDYDYERIGYEAARLLDQLIQKRERGEVWHKKSPPTVLVPPTGIVMRQTTDYYVVTDQRMREALQYINEHLNETISIDDVAYAVHVSRRTLTSLFRDHLGRGVAEEIQRLRLEIVKRELSTSDLSIKQIAAKAGYTSTRTLNDAFRTAEGCSPSAYRETFKANLESKVREI